LEPENEEPPKAETELVSTIDGAPSGDIRRSLDGSLRSYL
jgi:hypothetical protein